MFPSDSKKVARQVVTKHWDWEPHDLDDSQQLLEHVLELYNSITEETKYIHSDADTEVSYFTSNENLSV